MGTFNEVQAEKLIQIKKRLPELLQCPFCGSPVEVEPWHGGGPLKTMIQCSEGADSCAVGPSACADTPEQAANEWNTRA